MEARRESVPVVGAALDVIERDSAIGGGILAGALAYRLFFFLLPLGLVAIGILGLVSDATGRSPESLGGATGMGAFVTASVARAAEDDAKLVRDPRRRTGARLGLEGSCASSPGSIASRGELALAVLGRPSGCRSRSRLRCLRSSPS